MPEGLIEALNPDQVHEKLWKELPATAQFTIAFRYNMYRALMMGVRPGGRVPLWVQRMRGAEALARACDYPAHPILQETMRDCMERYIDADSVAALLKEIRAGRIRLVARRDGRQKPSPMTLSLRRQVEAEMMYAYAPVPEVAHSVAVQPDIPSIRPAEEQLLEAHTGAKTPDSPEQLHEKLMIEGDLLADETEAPFEWMQVLVDSGRAFYIEPGVWIAAEQNELYGQALGEKEEEALERVIRRCLRYRGPHTAAELAGRYALAEEQIACALNRLMAEEAVLIEEGQYIHAEVYRRAQRMTIRVRRHAVRTAEPSAYAHFLPEWQRESGSPRERLSAAVRRLYGLYLPLEHWESVILPARTTAYRPQMLDELLSGGEAIWRISEDGEKLAFFPADAVDWETDIPVHDQSEAAASVRRLLERRGASFSYAISAALPGVPVRDTLRRMALMGDAVCDSFSPLRKSASSANAKQKVRARIAGADGGRWELARPVAGKDMNERLQAAFDRWGIVARETAALEGILFQEALQLLRQMEYTGFVRRGYFVRGMSGAQFVRAEDYERIKAMLLAEREECVCLNAVDPAQAWGRIIKAARTEEESFLCVPGTAVVMRHGRPALILERQGTVLRMPDGSPEAFRALTDAFRSGRLYPQLRFLTIKTYPAQAARWLEEAGFVREMRDYVLSRN